MWLQGIRLVAAITSGTLLSGCLAAATVAIPPPGAPGITEAQRERLISDCRTMRDQSLALTLTGAGGAILAGGAGTGTLGFQDETRGSTPPMADSNEAGRATMITLTIVGGLAGAIGTAGAAFLSRSYSESNCAEALRYTEEE